MRIGLIEFLLILAIASLTVGPRVALFVDRWMRRANRANAMAARRRAEYAAQMAAERDAMLKRFRTASTVFGVGILLVLVYALGSSGVDLGIRCHVANDDFFVTKCELLERIKAAFDDAGISIPVPQQDMHLYVRDAQGKSIDMGTALSR